MSDNCNKCKQNLQWPWYSLYIDAANPDERKDLSYCLECWKQEERNYRKASWEYYKNPITKKQMTLMKYIAIRQGSSTSYIETAIMHWDEERKIWVGRDYEDKDVNPYIDKSIGISVEREREREQTSTEMFLWL